MFATITIPTPYGKPSCFLCRDQYGWTAVARCASKDFKTAKGAIRWLEKTIGDVIPTDKVNEIMRADKAYKWLYR